MLARRFWSALVSQAQSKWQLHFPKKRCSGQLVRATYSRGAQMELLIEEGLNKIGLGPQGASGKNSVMGVHIESAARHPSTISVAISVGCWAHRRGTIRINEDMSYEILSHKGVAL